MQSSSQNTIDKHRKKESVKSEYALAYINQEGQLKLLTPREIELFKEASEENQRLFRMMSEPEEFGEPIGPAPDKKFEKVILKVLNHFVKDESNQPTKGHTIFLFIVCLLAITTISIRPNKITPCSSESPKGQVHPTATVTSVPATCQRSGQCSAQSVPCVLAQSCRLRSGNLRC